MIAQNSFTEITVPVCPIWERKQFFNDADKNIILFAGSPTELH